MLGDDYGVRWIENYDCHVDPESGFLSSPGVRFIRELYPEVKTFGPVLSTRFPRRYATRVLTGMLR